MLSDMKEMMDMAKGTALTGLNGWLVVAYVVTHVYESYSKTSSEKVLATMEKKNQGLENKLATMEKKNQGLENNLATMEKILAAMEKRNQGLENRNHVLDNSLATMEKILATMEYRILVLMTIFATTPLALLAFLVRLFIRRS